MIITRKIYETRKGEVELCYSILKNLHLDEQPKGQIITIDEKHTERFAPILKSNILLMLYNLVEACVTQGFVEIYDSIEDNGLAYKDLIEDIRNMWSDNKIAKAKSSNASLSTEVRDIITTIISNGSITLKKDDLSISGNLDARVIRKLLDDHKIYITDKTEKFHMRLVKNKRNSLAHGLESFGDGSRDITVSQLEDIKDEVLKFIEAVIDCMTMYYDKQLYRVHK